MKKVVFIGGTSYSGSTFLDLIIANDPKGFSCGEVRALFRPWRPHHINPTCGCLERSCDIWPKILKNGEKHLYETIFDLFDVDFIVDSSKDLFWIHRQSINLKKLNIEAKNVLIWKTPLEIAHSFKKRGRLNEWRKNWLFYHRAYLTILDKYFPVKYSEFTTREQVLVDLCQYLEIPYYSDKIEYWNRTHHTLFGNTSAKIHLYPRDSEEYKQRKSDLVDESVKTNSNTDETHRSVYYNNIEDQSLIEMVDREMNSDPNLRRLLEVFSENRGHSQSDIEKNINDLKFSALKLQTIRMKSYLFQSLPFKIKLALS